MPPEEALTELAGPPPETTIQEVDAASVEMPPEPGQKPKPKPRRRLLGRGPKLNQVPDPEDLKAAAAERGARDELSEAEVVKAFYWLYYLWCRVLGAPVEARYADFTKIGKAWLELARKIPGAKVLVTILGPVVTMADLAEKLASAWSVRSRWRERPGWAKGPEKPAVVPFPERPEQQRGAGGD